MIKKKTTKLSNSDIYKIDLVREGAQQDSSIAIVKNKDGDIVEGETYELSGDELKTIKEASDLITKALDDKTNENENQTTTIKEETKVDTKNTETEVKKGNEEFISKSDYESVVKSLNDKIDAIMKANQDLVEKQKDSEFIAKANEIGDVTGIEKDKVAKTLRVINDLCPEDVYNDVESVFRANAAVAKSNGGIFKNIGSESNKGIENMSVDQAAKRFNELMDEQVAKSSDADAVKIYNDVCKTEEGAALYKVMKGQK